MFDKSSILEVCNANDVVFVTFTKASGEVTKRRTSFKAVPGELEGKGMRSFKDDQVNLFDADKMGWITVKVANVSEVVPA
jgi:hypothetical protein